MADCITKPAKPYPDFPLFAHGSGQWAKKILGRMHYFGKWDDWRAALTKYQAERDYHYTRSPVPTTPAQQGLTVGDLCNIYLGYQRDKVDTGELTQRSWVDLKRMAEIAIKHFGRGILVEKLTPVEFGSLRKKLADGRSLTTVDNEVTRVRCIFNHAYKAGLVEHPVRMGLSFQKPSRKAIRKEKQSKIEKLFTLEELVAIYGAASPMMKCFVLLGLNGGLGNHDVGLLEKRHIKDGWVEYPRPKTTVNRRFPLWPETKLALAKCIQTKRPDSPYAFVTKYGQLWAKDVSDSPITKEFSKLLNKLDEEAAAEAAKHRRKPPERKYKQAGRGFYSLRHTFRTIADGVRDQVAIDRVMGHADASMAANYRHGIDDERLQAVVDHVRNWALPIFGGDQ